MTDTTAVTLTPAEKKALKAQAHALDPVVLIGDKGLTPNVVKEIDMNLSAHGLIKVRVAGDDREARLEYAQTICDETGAALVQHIGKLLVLFRTKAEDPEKAKAKSRPKPKGPRQTKRQFASKA
ncbi:ribosome assembly RNA-binding protein YhbY [Limnobacter parvus]|uniref:Ribosome assembly RNA-binding protein YhbY n=1 Tax=Limnobacter parvus TaxID=2939690 RepID=A0ABT1XE83_9BURK|nr:ribosome assembly RNA-binding protein YhbY [Limnobacter parvus]MCR2745581.1 ribosome assembly RNA-binding protein YhbY [Limnobacter parvus]